MAFGGASSLGNANSKAGTTVSLTVNDNVAVGDIIVALVATDNTVTADGNGTEVSVSDSGGNVYTRAIEYANAQGAAKAGAEAAIFYSVCTVALTISVSTITLTNATSGYARCINAHKFTHDNSAVLTLAQTNQAVADAADLPAVATSGLTSREYLHIGVGATESNAGPGGDAGWTNTTGNFTTGGGAAANMGLVNGYLISTTTGATYNAVSGFNSDCVAVIAAFWDQASTPKSLVFNPAPFQPFLVR